LILSPQQYQCVFKSLNFPGDTAEDKKSTTERKKSSATSSTSLKSKKKIEPSKKDLEMFKLFLKTFKHSNSDAENDTSLEESISQSHDPNLFRHDPFTSQDPIPGLNDSKPDFE
jgi:hypothetical protein